MDAIKTLVEMSGKNGVGKLEQNSKDNSGWTALMCACSNGFTSTFNALKDVANCSITSSNSCGRTALHVAAGKGMESVVKIILRDSKGKGLVNKEDEKGWTPAFDAAIHGHKRVLDLLVENGAEDRVDRIGKGWREYLP